LLMMSTLSWLVYFYPPAHLGWAEFVLYVLSVIWSWGNDYLLMITLRRLVFYLNSFSFVIHKLSNHGYRISLLLMINFSIWICWVLHNFYSLLYPRRFCYKLLVIKEKRKYHCKWNR
jgi:hypothetical protein